VDHAGKAAKIVVSSTPNLCADIANNVERPNARLLLLDVIDTDSADSDLTAGIFMASDASPPPPRSAVFESNVTDASCAVSYVPPPDGTGNGTVSLTSVSASTLTGSFDVVLENSEHVTGTFTPAGCPALGMSQSGTPACVP
jgi:hypothetical protein